MKNFLYALLLFFIVKGIIGYISNDTSTVSNQRYSIEEITEPPTPSPTESYIYTGSTFNGYECTEDCSGHEAGYEWASDNDITDPEECSGNSDSFIEGCQSYAEEKYTSEYEDEYYDEREYEEW